MMTPLSVSDALKRELESYLQDYKLPMRNPEVENAVSVYQQYIPQEKKNSRRNDDLEDSLYPYIVIRLLSGQDGMANQGGVVKGVLVFGTYDSNDGDSWKDLFNLIEHVRLRLDSIRMLGGWYVLGEPLRWEVPEEQGVNHMQGLLYFSYEIGKENPEVDWDGEEFR